VVLRLKSLTLAGFEGIGTDPGLVLEALTRSNIFIGPNNVGKSSLFRFLSLLKQVWLRTEHSGLSVNLAMMEGATDRMFWNCHTDTPIVAEIVLCDIDASFGHTAGLEVVHDGQSKFGISIVWAPEAQLGKGQTVPARPILTVVPYYFVGENWLPHYRYSSPDQFIQMDGRYQQGNQLSGGYIDFPKKIFSTWTSTMKFFDPVRALNKGATKTLMDDGSLLVSGLYELSVDQSQSTQYHKLKRKILQLVNELLAPSGVAEISEFLIKGSKPSDLSLQLVPSDLDLPISIDSMGTGISEIFMTCCWLAMEPGMPRLYLLEEPETHLHPGLLRRYLDLFQHHEHIQLLINTHSNILLNNVTADSKVWSFERRKGETRAVPCDEFTRMHSTLDALGINGASLLQANCAIWVEGPSDRIYIRKWLKHHISWKEQPVDLIEGSDYSFVFYGGKVLAHYALDDGVIGKMLSMLKISRFSAVVMDRDLAPNVALEELAPAKLAIIQSAKNDPKHRCAVVTNGREIENDVFGEVFVKSIAEVIGYEAELSSLKLTGNKRFHDEIVDHLDLSGDEATRVKRKLMQHKVNIAENHKLSPFQFSDWDAPTYISVLYEFIVRSRLDIDEDEIDEVDIGEYEEGYIERA